ncbi:transcription factor bHLH62 isoform X1 [Capsicum galapagoense]
MLNEIISYVQALQHQFLSMKLALVNPTMDFHIDGLLYKEISQPNVSLHQHVLPLDGHGKNLTQGEYLTLTRDKMGGEEMISYELATHYSHSSFFNEFQAELLLQNSRV